jgi:hypothetical protein
VLESGAVAQADRIARLAAHTAFDDPASSADAPSRRSIEARALVFWRALHDRYVRETARLYAVLDKRLAPHLRQRPPRSIRPSRPRR